MRGEDYSALVGVASFDGQTLQCVHVQDCHAWLMAIYESLHLLPLYAVASSIQCMVLLLAFYLSEFLPEYQILALS